MEFLLGIAGSLVGKTIELTVEPVCRQVGYIFNYKSNIASLETDVNNLSGLRTEMQQKSERATRNLETIHDNVEEWMRSAERAFEDAEDFLKNYEEHAKAKCSIWYFPNLVLRHELSKEAKTKADSIAKLCSSIPQDPISSAKVLPSSDEMIEGYEAFESRNSIMNQIMDALRNPEVQVVGLHGMGGVGKTMLAKEVSRRARLDKVFDIDVMVTVSHVQNPKDIQQHIAEKLCLKLDDKTLSARADKLRLRLRQERKNILLILDDVWDKLDLQEIGVSIGNNQNGCKILLTSRSAKVCSLMKAGSTTFMLEALPKKEAIELFNKNVGDSARGPNFEILVKEIIKECAGLPIAIVVVASALKNRGEEVWEDVLLELKTSSPANIEGLDKKVYSSIKLSYNHLPNDNAKKLLLLCSLHAEDEVILIEDLVKLIEDLVKYGTGLSWFYNTKRLKEARNRVYHLVVTLKERSLLLDGIEGRSVKLHDVIRDVCLSIASQDKDMHFIRDIDHLEEFIQNEKLEKATGISLPNEAINHLPEKFEWPHLKLLLSRKGNTEVKIMDEQCFKEMKNLRVLYLRDIQVNPTCFSLLQKLQTLCLRGCRFLGDIAPIGELNQLKILELSRSGILKLPKEIGQLTHLQLLDLGSCYDLRYVESQVLSNLRNLEQLRIESFEKWGVEGVNSNENVSLVELNNLDKLTTLYVSVPNSNSVPKFWLSNKMHLERYKISTGDWDPNDVFGIGRHKTSKMLLLKLVKTHQVKAHGLERFIGTAEALYLDGFEDLNDIFELDNKGFQHVEHFLFKCNERVQYFINPPDPCRAFLSLKSLFLEKMMNLEKICHGKLISESFSKLKKVKVRKCKRLKSLFSFSIAKHFEKIYVKVCPEVKEIGTQENEHESQNAINDSMNETKSCKLKTLKLVDLPKLTRFFWPEQEINSILDRGDELFNSKVVFPKLRNMTLSGIEVVKLWPNELHEASFMKNLTTLKVTKCSGLKYLSSFDVAKSLELLESLKLSDLEALKMVIVVKKQMDEVERMEKKLFPKLCTLELFNLQNMAEFCSECCFEFPSLKFLRIEKCPKVTDLDLIGNLSNLEVLYLSYSSFVELPRGIERLTQLKSLDLSNWKCLKVIQPDVISELIHLEELKMPKSYVTWGAEGVSTGTKRSASLSELKNLPQLTVLELSVLDFNFLPKDFFSEKWKNCRITTNKGSYIFFTSGCLALKLKKREINVRECGLQVLLKRSEELLLDGLEKDMDGMVYDTEWFSKLRKLKGQEEDMDDIVYELDKDRFPQLRNLTLKNNGGARSLVNSIRHSSNTAFVSLKRLFLFNLITLERICHGELIRGSFGKLRRVSVVKCARLKSLFPISVATQLTELVVDDCEAMEAIFTIEREDDNDLAFTELQILSLRNLPGLVQFCSKLKTTSTSRWKEEPSEEELGISMPLFDAKVQMPNLMDEVERMEKKLFPKLHTLQLMNLQNMAEFCSQCCFEFPSLKVLRINNCPKVADLDLIEKSSNLEVLDLSYSSFLELPRGIERLTQLKSLDLSGCKYLKVIQHDVISELIHLEKLKMLKSHVTWGAEGVSSGTKRSSVSLSELKNLPQLTILELSVPDFSFLPKDFFIEKWKSCRITTNKGSNISFSTFGYLYSSKLEIKLKKREINVWECGLQVLLKRSEELLLDGLEEDMDDIVYELDKEEFPQLRELTLKNNGGVRYLVNSIRHSSNVAFVSLERLCLYNLTTLERIYHGELIRGSFGKLWSGNVVKCARLKSLFPISIATQLKELIVSDCKAMEAIVTMEGEDDNDLAFTKLKILSLRNLPRLVQFCSKLKTTTTSRWKEEPSKEELEISMPLFDAKVIFPKLARLIVDNCEIINEIFDLEGQSCFDKLENLDLDNKLVIPKPMHKCGKNLHLGIGKRKAFQYLKDIEIKRCNGLMKLFSSSTFKGMVCLQKIIISECKGMTEIIENDHKGVVENEIVLEQLIDLKLCDLPNLRCFYSGNNTITFPYLDNLVVSQCFEMKTFSHGIVNSPFLDRIITEPKSKVKEEQDWEGNINSTIQKIYEKWKKKSESSSNEQVTSEKDTTMGNNEPSTEFSGGDQVKRDTWKGKEQVTKSSSSGSNSAFF